jgi:hypothetical protein
MNIWCEIRRIKKTKNDEDIYLPFMNRVHEHPTGLEMSIF